MATAAAADARSSMELDTESPATRPVSDMNGVHAHPLPHHQTDNSNANSNSKSNDQEERSPTPPPHARLALNARGQRSTWGRLHRFDGLYTESLQQSAWGLEPA
ncbi:predicted protein [Histoplasma capsulatum var. duboisii H88]|uniref:Predicted protein n=2 Tax=Ajellomyces capsulatus TaxID=5037 RepID=F0UGI5_AJEC8|nr:predicted protein [Histoplasma capsulatum H143]EGC45127.1 predicted protein [Histoplasma capsulatum var. duboisii H88]